MPKKVKEFLYFHLTDLGLPEIQLKTDWKHFEHLNVIFKAMGSEISCEASLIGDGFMVREVVDKLAMDRVGVEVLGPDLFPSEMVQRTSYIKYVVQVLVHLALRIKIFSISSALFPGPR